LLLLLLVDIMHTCSSNILIRSFNLLFSTAISFSFPTMLRWMISVTASSSSWSVSLFGPVSLARLLVAGCPPLFLVHVVMNVFGISSCNNLLFTDNEHSLYLAPPAKRSYYLTFNNVSIFSKLKSGLYMYYTVYCDICPGCGTRFGALSTMSHE
jgi:hypothetical protein